MAETMEESSKDKAEPVSAEDWEAEFAAAEKELSKFWRRGKRVLKKYMDEEKEDSTDDRYNVFWANIGVLKASLYANPPKPVVKREFDDQNDDIARVGAIMMERMLNQGLLSPEDELHVAFHNCVEDRLLPGLGQTWCRYEPETIQTALGEELVNECAPIDYVYWEDFWWSPARTWQEVRWVARRVWMNKKEFTKRFPKTNADTVEWTKKTPDKTGERVTPNSMGVLKTEVFEIWDKPTHCVIFFSRSCKTLLEKTEDPLELDGFFPCPKPLLATHTTSSLVPKADYLMVQAQYRRLDTLTQRIGLLEEAVQASGVYDKTNKELGQLLPANGNKMIPVDNWAAFAEKGGMKGVVDWFPVEIIVNALDKLRELKAEAKAELYELTGISDIMRGVTKERETAYAQGLKAQYSSVRLQFVQGDVARFIQETLRIKANIISKHFQPETIIKQSLIELTPDANLAQQAAMLLKDAWSFAYRIQVFADTLAIPDYNAERQGRTEFIGAVGQFMSQIQPILQMEPASAPFFLEILKWGIASFRSAQSIEGVFDKAAAALMERIKNPPPKEPTPEELKAQAEIQGEQEKLKLKVVETQTELAADKQKTEAEVYAIHAKTNAAVAATNAKTLAQIAAMRAKARESANAKKVGSKS